MYLCDFIFHAKRQFIKGILQYISTQSVYNYVAIRRSGWYSCCVEREKNRKQNNAAVVEKMRCYNLVS